MRWVAAAWGLFILSTVVVEWFDWESSASAVVIVPLLMSVLYSQVYRYRSVSTPSQKEQTKWLIVAIALNVVQVAVDVTLARPKTPITSPICRTAMLPTEAFHNNRSKSFVYQIVGKFAGAFGTRKFTGSEIVSALSEFIRILTASHVPNPKA